MASESMNIFMDLSKTIEKFIIGYVIILVFNVCDLMIQSSRRLFWLTKSDSGDTYFSPGSSKKFIRLYNDLVVKLNLILSVFTLTSD